MTLISFFYYLMSAFLLVLLGWSFLKSGRDERDNAVLYLLVMLPLILRLLRFK